VRGKPLKDDPGMALSNDTGFSNGLRKMFDCTRSNQPATEHAFEVSS